MLHTINKRNLAVIAKKTDRMQLVISPEEVAEIDEWRRQQKDLPSRSEAVRRLVRKGMGKD